MKYTTKIQSAIGKLPIAGANLLVDADFEEPKSAASFLADLAGQGGPSSTVIMPAFTGTQTLVGWTETPRAFHGELPVEPRVGIVSEAFRQESGTLRSGHPTHSFLAIGTRAHDVLSTNRDNNPLGPIKKLNVMNGLVLLVGLPLSRCTALYQAEMQALPALRYRGTAQRINVAGYEERVVVEHAPRCSAGYDRYDEAVQSEEAGLVGDFDGVRLWRLRELIRSAAEAILAAPESILCDDAACPDCELRRSAIARL